MDDIDVIIASYLTGNASLEEMKFLKEWLASDTENLAYFQKQKEIWLAASGARYDSGNAYSRFQRKVHKNKSASRTVLFRYAGIGLAVAACLLTVVIFSFRHGARSVSEPAALAEFSVSAPAGSMTSITLPDGTAVTLNSDSRIVYCQSFGLTERNLSLYGEAYFDVKHDEKLPLTVKVNGATIRDIGTRFNIRAHDNDDFISVAVIEGCAEVHNLLGSGNEYTVLNANQMAEIFRNEGRMRVTGLSSISPAGWTDGSLAFENATLLTIVNELSRKYKVHVMIANEDIRDTRFYCCFAGDGYSLEDVLKSLEATGKVRCEKNGSTIIFK